jgi:ribosomal protein L21E
MGPLPVTDRRNRYILVIGDYFTKWVEAFPMQNQEAQTVARVLVNEFICRFGTPEFIHTDQGRNFESALFRELCILLNVKKTRTTAYHPQSDGFIERFNRTLQTMLSMYVNDQQKDWDLNLQHVMLAYRSSTHETTGYTPHYLLTGREVTLPVDIMFGNSPERSPSVGEYVARIRSSLMTAYEIVRKTSESQQRRQKEYYDREVHGLPYAVGDCVWLHVPSVKRGRSHKFHRPWQGPFRIANKLSDVTYRIQAVGRKRKRLVVHFNRLKPCKEHIQPVVAEHDQTDEHNIDNDPTQTTQDDGRMQADPRNSNDDAGDSNEEDDYLEYQAADLTGTNQDRDSAAEQRTVEVPAQDHVQEDDHVDDPPTSRDGDPLHLPVGSTATAHIDHAHDTDDPSTNAPPGVNTSDEPTLTRRDRTRRPPAWTQDYELT